MTLFILSNINSGVLASALFIGIILFYFFGLKVSHYKKKKDPSYEPSGIGALEGSLLGLLALLLAFTFNKSSSYYDSRREILIQETNNIGTALLRADLYPDSVRQILRSDFKRYINERIQYFECGDDENKIQASLKKSNEISERIWKVAAMISGQDRNTTRSMQMIPALNNMIDAVTAREEARKAHVPSSILWLLFFLCVIGSFIVGYSEKSKKADWIILISYSLMTVMTVFLILDLDQPRHGIINTRNTHHYMYKLLDSFKNKE